MKNLFSNPLILGASISAGYGTRDGGPGTILAKKYNPEALIINKAMSGATSIQSTKNLDLNALNPSIVLGFDLFFWDVVRGTVGVQFEKNTHRIFDSFQEKNIPMIVGKIPSFDFPIGLKVSQIIKSAEKVNLLLQELSSRKKNCLLFDPLECFMNMDSELHFSDGLHLTREGNIFCADYFSKSVILEEILL